MMTKTATMDSELLIMRIAYGLDMCCLYWMVCGCLCSWSHGAKEPPLVAKSNIKLGWPVYGYMPPQGLSMSTVPKLRADCRSHPHQGYVVTMTYDNS